MLLYALCIFIELLSAKKICSLCAERIDKSSRSTKCENMITDFFSPKSKKRAIWNKSTLGREKAGDDSSLDAINEQSAALSVCPISPNLDGLGHVRYVLSLYLFLSWYCRIYYVSPLGHITS